MPRPTQQRIPRTLVLGGVLLMAAFAGLLAGFMTDSLWLTFLAGAAGIGVGLFAIVWSFRGKLRARQKASQTTAKGTGTRAVRPVDGALAARVSGAGSEPGALALIATSALLKQINCPFVQLVPGLVRSQLDGIQPSTLLIEEAALRLHPWSGVLEPGHSGSLGQLVDAIGDVQARDGRAYIIHDPVGLAFGSQLLRATSIPLTSPEAGRLFSTSEKDAVSA